MNTKEMLARLGIGYYMFAKAEKNYVIERPERLGSIYFVPDGWIADAKKKIAHFIANTHRVRNWALNKRMDVDGNSWVNFTQSNMEEVLSWD